MDASSERLWLKSGHFHVPLNTKHTSHKTDEQHEYVCSGFKKKNNNNDNKNEKGGRVILLLLTRGQDGGGGSVSSC